MKPPLKLLSIAILFALSWPFIRFPESAPRETAITEGMNPSQATEREFPDTAMPDSGRDGMHGKSVADEEGAEDRFAKRVDDGMRPHVIGSNENGQFRQWSATRVILKVSEAISPIALQQLKARGFTVSEPMRPRVHQVSWAPEADPAGTFDRRVAALLELLPGAVAEKDYLFFVHQAAEGTWWESTMALDYILDNGIRADGQLIAVLDTGIDFGHEALTGTQFINTAESLDGLDSDGNGYVDDVHGYDFVDLDPHPLDEAGHGTAMAGAIAAVDSGYGVRGIAQGAKLLNIRVMDESGTAFVSDIIRGVEYARSMGATVINMSLGGPGYSEVLQEALREAIEAGALCVAAAGNDGKNIDSGAFRVYPANYQLEGLLTVGAVAAFSNYGMKEVDWLLPGENILLPALGEEKYRIANGTSISAAMMSGLAAVLKAASPGMSWADLQIKLIQSSEPRMAWKPRVENWGQVRADQFLEGIYIPIPQLDISVQTTGYYVGDIVQLAVLDVPDSEGNLTWYRDGVPFGTNGASQSTIAPHPSENIGYHCVLETYYGRAESPLIHLLPQTGPLKLTDAFRDVIEIPFASPFTLTAAVEGSPPIEVTWFDEAGNLLGTGSRNFNNFTIGNQKGYYFKASNGVDTLTSPIIQLKVKELDLAAVRSNQLIFTMDVGNGVYLSNIGRSVDGIHWEPFGSDIPQQFSRIFFWRDRFYGYAYGNSMIEQLHASTYGTVWAPVPFPRGFRRIDPVGDFLVAFDSEDTWHKSSDGLEWTSLNALSEVQYAGGFYYGNNGSEAVYSSDMSAWNPLPGISGKIDAIVHTEGLWLAVNNGLVYSRDGVQWSPLQGPAFVPEALIHVNSHYYASSGSYLYGIGPDLTVSSFLTHGDRLEWLRLSDGQLLWIGEIDYNTKTIYYLQKDSIPQVVDSIALLIENATRIQLGDTCSAWTALKEEEIASVRVFNQLGLLEHRKEPPFYEPLLIPGIGEHHLSMHIEGKDGRTYLTDSRTVEVVLDPSVEFPLETGYRYEDHRLYRSEAGLGLRIRNNGALHLLEDIESGSPTMQTIPWVSACDVFGDGIYGLEMTDTGGHQFLAFGDNQWQVLSEGPASFFQLVLAGNRLFGKEPASTGSGFDLVESIAGSWVPVVSNLPDFYILGGTTFLDGRSALFIRLPSLDESRYLFQSPSGNWRHQTYEGNANELRLESGSLLVYSREGIVGGPGGLSWSTGHLPDFISREAPHGRWLPLMNSSGWWESRILANVDGRQLIYQLEGDLSSSPDPTGRYLFATSGGAYRGDLPTRGDLYPANEFLLRRESERPLLLPGKEQLTLLIQVEMKQLNLGGRVDVPCTFDIFLDKDETPSLETSTHLGTVTVPLQLDLLASRKIDLPVTIPENLLPGTYSIGVFLNRNNPDVPESTLSNNLVWQEWTLERYARLEKAALPSSARIFLTPDSPNPVVGESIEISFTPREGFRFSGWGPALETTENPTSIRLPNVLYLSAGEIPAALDDLLSGVNYTGHELWHSSGFLGWFIGEYFPWLYHLQHGWMFLHPASTEGSVYYFDASLGWTYFNATTYPYVYVYSSGNWHYYLRETRDPRWFLNVATGEWLAL